MDKKKEKSEKIGLFSGFDEQKAKKSEKMDKYKEQKDKKEKVIKTDDKKRPKKKSGNAKKNKGLNFNTYIHRVLKQVHKNTGITKGAMQVMNDLVMNAFLQVTEEAGKLVKRDNRDTLTSRDIHSAVRLVLPGELAAHSGQEGTQALRTFDNSTLG